MPIIQGKMPPYPILRTSIHLSIYPFIYVCLPARLSVDMYPHLILLLSSLNLNFTYSVALLASSSDYSEATELRCVGSTVGFSVYTRADGADISKVPHKYCIKGAKAL